MSRLCVVGAGAAGAGAAYALRETHHDVTLLEKSRGVGGRAATRRRNGRRYDHGANFVKPGEAADAARLDTLLDDLGREGLADIDEPVWTFDADGEIHESDDNRDAPKWTWEAGITQLAKRLLAATDAEVRKTTRVESLAERDGEWRVTDADGTDHGPFDAVLLTPPAPQTAELLRATTAASLDGSTLDAAREAIDAVPYRTIRTLVLGYDHPVERPYYALVDTSKERAVGWVSREECKPGRVPDGESLLVVQMSPEWSTAHYDDPLEEAAAAAAGHVAGLLGDDRLRDPDWVDEQGWRYALPDAAVERSAVAPAESAGLFFAGDWVVGEARVHAALWNGVAVGERVGGWLDG